MSDIYKIVLLDKNIIKKIYVFYGDHNIDNIDNLFKSDPKNKVFENVFSNLELTNISSENIVTIFVKTKIYIDDTISTVKKKIIQASLDNEDQLCFEELYLFCKNLETLNNIEIYQNISQQGKLEITKKRLLQYLLNIDNFDISSIPDKEVYTYDDLINLNLNNNKKAIDHSIGQKSLSTIKSYSYTVNPFKVSFYDNLLQSNTENLISTTNNYNLMKQDFILDNNIYVCLFNDVINFTKQKSIDISTTIKLYYPYISDKGINSQAMFNEKHSSLLLESKNLINEKFIKNTKNVEMFYNVYSGRSVDINYIEQGIKHIDFTLYPTYKIIMPLDVIFKLIHANKKIPFIKYNYSNRQEKMYRLYCDNTSKNGKKIPFLQKNLIFKLAKTIGKNKSITCYIIDEKSNYIYFQLDVNGNISIQIDLKKSENINDIEKIIDDNINPIISIIKDYLKQSGYEYNLFKNLHDENVEIVDIKYFSYLSIEKNIQLHTLIGCVSSIFNVIVSELKKGIIMRYKRVSNFNELDSQQAFIIEMLNKSNHETDILKALIDNYQLNEDEAKLKVASLLDQIEIEQNLNKNRKLRIKNNPGFLTKITQDQYQNNIAIEVDNINDIQYLQTIPIYLDSLIRITQNLESTTVNSEYINNLCSTDKEEDDIEIKDVIANPEKNFVEAIPVSIQAQDLVFDEVENEENKENKSSTILDMLYADSDEEESEEESEDEKSGGAPKLKIVDSTALKKDITGMSLNNPNPFFSKMLKRDPKLFLTKGDGKYNAYSRSCPWNIRRQPVILTDKEKENIDKNHPDSYEHAIKYGSSPENQYWYICPRYWSLKDNVSLSKKDVDSGKYGNIIPAKATVVPKNASIFEFTDPKDHIDDDGNYRKHYPGFLKSDKHPDGLCIPCCFKTWDKQGQPERRKECSASNDLTRDTQEKTVQQKEDRDEYIKGPDKFPLEKNRWGYLPLLIQRFFKYDNSKCYINKLNTNLKKDHPCLVRQGVENSKNKSFVACIADLYSYHKSLQEGKTKIEDFYNFTIEEMIDNICNSITIDNFVTYQNGNLPNLFKVENENLDNYLENIEKDKESTLYKNLKTEDKQLFSTLSASMSNFKKYLKDNNNLVDHTYLWDIVCTPNKNLFNNGINLVILEISQDDISNNVKVICPSNHYSNQMFNKNKKTLLLIKKYEYYEPIYIATDNSKIRSYTLERALDFNSIPELSDIFEFVTSIYNNMCTPLKSITENIEFSQNKILADIKYILEIDGFKINSQVLNYDFKTVGLIVERKNDCNIDLPTQQQKEKLSGFVPCYPSNVDSNIDIKYLDDDIWNNYTETIYFLRCVFKITKNKIECYPDYKVLDDKLIVGVLTHTNQFIPIDKPTQNTFEDGIPELNNGDYIIADKKVKTSNKLDNERINYIKKIELETKKYNDFRNLFKLTINKYENLMKKKELEKIIYSNSMLYIMKLDNVIVILKDILKDKVQFKSYGKDFLKEGDVLFISDKNLINNTDNNVLYYGKLADEIIRYNRIKQFIFEPKIYLSFHNVKYNLLDNEVILLHSLLFSDYFIDLDPETKNTFNRFNTYDTSNPINTVYYSQKYIEKKSDLKLTSICDSSIKPIYGQWEKEFPSNYKEIIFSNDNKECSFDILNNLFSERPLEEYKKTLVTLYQPYFEKNSTKLLNIISEYNLKKEVKEIKKNNLSLEKLILSKDYILTNLDIILLSQYFDIPVVLLSSKSFFENGLNIIKTKNSFYFYIIRSPVFYSKQTSENNTPKYRLYIDNKNNKLIDFKNVSNNLKTLINENNPISVDDIIDNFNNKNINKNPVGKLKINTAKKEIVELETPLSNKIETQPVIKDTVSDKKKKPKLKLVQKN